MRAITKIEAFIVIFVLIGIMLLPLSCKERKYRDYKQPTETQTETETPTENVSRIKILETKNGLMLVKVDNVEYICWSHGGLLKHEKNIKVFGQVK